MDFRLRRAKEREQELPDREEDLSFADFVAVSGAPGQPLTAPQDAVPERESPDATNRERSGILERETGFEPATLSLGKRKVTQKRR